MLFLITLISCTKGMDIEVYPKDSLNQALTSLDHILVGFKHQISLETMNNAIYLLEQTLNTTLPLLKSLNFSLKTEETMYDTLVLFNGVLNRTYFILLPVIIITMLVFAIFLIFLMIALAKIYYDRRTISKTNYDPINEVSPLSL